VPAVFEHQKVAVNFIGTAVFVVRDGQPHLRIFMNQQEEDLRKVADFVAPQLVQNPLRRTYLRWPKTASTKIEGAVALMNLEVDLKGKVKGATVAFEHPEGMGFGEEGLRFIHEYDFIPGFRDGKPVACKFEFPVFWGNGHKWKIE
jgi:hypothetical protein